MSKKRPTKSPLWIMKLEDIIYIVKHDVNENAIFFSICFGLLRMTQWRSRQEEEHSCYLFGMSSVYQVTCPSSIAYVLSIKISWWCNFNTICCLKQSVFNKVWFTTLYKPLHVATLASLFFCKTFRNFGCAIFFKLIFDSSATVGFVVDETRFCRTSF